MIISVQLFLIIYIRLLQYMKELFLPSNKNSQLNHKHI